MKVEPPKHGSGCSVADVAPMTSFGGAEVIEGVY